MALTTPVSVLDESLNRIMGAPGVAAAPQVAPVSYSSLPTTPARDVATTSNVAQPAQAPAASSYYIAPPAPVVAPTIAAPTAQPVATPVAKAPAAAPATGGAPGANYQYWGQEFNDPIAQQAYKEVWLHNSPDAQKSIDQSVALAQSYQGLPGSVFNSNLNPLNWGSGHIYNSPELRQKYIDLGGQAYNAYDYHAATNPASVGQPYTQATGAALPRYNPTTGLTEYPDAATGMWNPAPGTPGVLGGASEPITGAEAATAPAGARRAWATQRLGELAGEGMTGRPARQAVRSEYMNMTPEARQAIRKTPEAAMTRVVGT